MNKYFLSFLVLASQPAYSSGLYVSTVGLGPFACSAGDGTLIAHAQDQATKRAFDHLARQGCHRPVQISVWKSRVYKEGWPYAPEVCRSKQVRAAASFGCQDAASGYTLRTTGVDEGPYGAQRNAENAAAFYCNVDESMIRRISDWEMVNSPYGASTASATFSCGY